MRYMTHYQRVNAYKHLSRDNWTLDMTARKYGVSVSAVEAMLRSQQKNAKIGLGWEAVTKICDERDAGLNVRDISLYWNVPERVILTLKRDADFVPGREPGPSGYAFPRDKYDVFIADYDRIPPKTMTRKDIAAKYGLTENQLNWITSGGAKNSRIVSPEVKEQIMKDIEALNGKSIRRLADKYDIPYDIARSWIGNHLKELKEAEAALGR